MFRLMDAGAKQENSRHFKGHRIPNVLAVGSGGG